MIKYLHAVISKFTGVVYGLLLLKLLSLYLTEADFSSFFIHYNLVIYFAAAAFGLQNQIILRFFHIVGEKRIFYLTNSLSTYAIGTLLILIIILNYFLDSYSMFLVFMATVSFGIFGTLTSLFRIKHTFKNITYQLVMQSVFAILFIYIFRESLDYKITLMIIAASYLFTSAIILRGVRVSKIKRFFSLKILKSNKKLLNYAWPLVLIGLFNATLSSMDQYFLLYYDYTDELPAYIANYNIAEKSIILVLSIITLVFIPTIFRRYKSLEVKAFQDIFKVAFIYILISIPIVIMLYFFADKFTLILADEKYVNMSWIIPYIAIGGMFLGFNSIISDIFTIQYKTKTLMACYLSGFLTNFILNILFIGEYGIKGAIFTTISSYIVMLMITLSLIYREYNKCKEGPYNVRH